MKKAHYCLFLFLILSLILSLSACKKKAEFEPVPASSSAGQSEGGEPPPSVEQTTTGGPMELNIFDEVNRQLQPVFFDYDKYDIREDQITALQGNSRVLKQNPTVSVLIEGHCDERGTEEYN